MKNHWLQARTQKVQFPSGTDLEETARAWKESEGEECELNYLLSQQLFGQLWAIARVIVHHKRGWGNHDIEMELVKYAFNSVRRWEPGKGRLANVVTTVMMNLYYGMKRRETQ